MTLKEQIETMKRTASHDHSKCPPVKAVKDAIDPALLATWEAGRSCGFHAGWDEGFRSTGKVLRAIHELYPSLERTHNPHSTGESST